MQLSQQKSYLEAQLAVLILISAVKEAGILNPRALTAADNASLQIASGLDKFLADFPAWELQIDSINADLSAPSQEPPRVRQTKNKAKSRRT